MMKDFDRSVHTFRNSARVRSVDRQTQAHFLRRLKTITPCDLGEQGDHQACYS